MIFGRAGEEIASLRAAGIPVEVVPGITAGIAAASRLGVSLTHRDHAHSVRFVTGHARDGSLPPDLDWRGIAHPATTPIIDRKSTRLNSRHQCASHMPSPHRTTKHKPNTHFSATKTRHQQPK